MEDGKRLALISTLVFAASLFALGFNLGSHGIATSYVDPINKLLAQDESVYAAISIHMANGGSWLTPEFLGRYAF